MREEHEVHDSILYGTLTARTFGKQQQRMIITKTAIIIWFENNPILLRTKLNIK